MGDELLHGLLRRSAERHPDRPAVVEGTRSITYADLDARSDRLARLLVAQGVRPQDRVGLYLDKSIDATAGIYGVLKAGATYVPLDPHAPPARLAYIARDCGVEVLISGAAKAEAWPRLLAGGAPLRALVVQDDDAAPPEAPAGLALLTSADVDRTEATSPDAPTTPTDLAYVLYTSGSTGDPKGVMLSHANALTFVRWATEMCELTPHDRLSSHAPLHFDLSVFDLFAAAHAGASVTLVPQQALVFPAEAARFIREGGITVWYSVPSALSLLAQRGGVQPGDLPGLRVVLFAGEVFPTRFLRRAMELIPDARFVNLYGPTETNVCTWYEVPALAPHDDEPIPIGTAIADTEVFAVTDAGVAAADGEAGELYVTGGGVMRGYWGDRERSARALVPDPRRPGSGTPAYRTGDLVRRDADGAYRLLGRRDSQIKSRGYRIELGDVEAAIYAHPDVVECAVTAVPDELISNRIRAHVVARPGLDRAALVRFCSERIPHYMIPDTIEFRDALPKTSTGKVDRRVLSAR